MKIGSVTLTNVKDIDITQDRGTQDVYVIPNSKIPWEDDVDVRKIVLSGLVTPKEDKTMAEQINDLLSLVNKPPSSNLISQDYAYLKTAVDELVTSTSIEYEGRLGDVFSVGDYIKIDSEAMLVRTITDTPATPNTLTVYRNRLGTTRAAHSADRTIYIYYRPTQIALINDSGGITAADTTIDYDTATSSIPCVIDDYIKIDSEIMKVSAINTSTKVITVARAQLGTSAAIHANDASIKKLVQKNLAGYIRGFMKVTSVKPTVDATKKNVREVSINGTLYPITKFDAAYLAQA